MVTIYDIARETGISPSTVSKVFNHYKGVSKKSEEAVKAAAKKLGYYPAKNAQALITKRNWCLGLAFNYDQPLALCNPHYSEIIEGFQTLSESLGYDVMIMGLKSYKEHPNYPAYCKMRGIDGILSFCSGPQTSHIYEAYQSGIPCLSIEAKIESVPYVICDNADGIRQAINYIISKGHEKIGYISGPLTSFAGHERFDAFIKCMRENNLPIQPDYIAYGQDFTYEDGVTAARRLLKQCTDHLPTCILCAYDEYAGAAYLLLQNNGLMVPRDISICGFDDLSMAKYLSLTTVRQNRLEIGHTAARVLIDMINEKEILNKEIRIKTELISRTSC